jgi:prepilin-type N-terminal cleavage/methylation domain-containing protein
MKYIKNKKGFTLIELIIVISVLGVILSIATTKYGNVFANAKIKSNQANYDFVREACILAQAKDDLPDDKFDYVHETDEDLLSHIILNNYQSILVPKYIDKIPSYVDGDIVHGNSLSSSIPEASNYYNNLEESNTKSRFEVEERYYDSSKQEFVPLTGDVERLHEENVAILLEAFEKEAIAGNVEIKNGDYGRAILSVDGNELTSRDDLSLLGINQSQLNEIDGESYTYHFIAYNSGGHNFLALNASKLDSNGNPGSFTRIAQIDNYFD